MILGLTLAALAVVVSGAPVLAGSVGEGLAAWRDAGKADLEFAVLLEQLGRADAVPGNPWAS